MHSFPKERYQLFKRFVTTERKPFFEIVQPFVEGKKIIIDLGAGTDEFAKTIGREDTYLLEANEHSYRQLKEKYPNVFLWRAQEPLPFATQSAGLMHLSHLIEHLQPEDCYYLLKEIDRVLAPHGNLVISTPCLNPDFYNDLSHVKPYNPAVFLRYLVWDPICSTRPVISSKYIQKYLVYRYSLEAIPRFGSKYFFLDLVGWSITSLLTRLGIDMYKKTGYTLILEKNRHYDVTS